MFPKRSSRSRLVLQLRGGGDGSGPYGSFQNDPRLPQLSEVYKSPVIKPNLAMKVFIVLDDPFISTTIVLVDVVCSFATLIVSWGWLIFLGNFLLYVMVFSQLLEIYLNSTYANRMLAEGNRVRVMNRIHVGTGKKDEKRVSNYLLPGSVGTVSAIRERVRHRKDEGALITLDGDDETLHLVLWFHYRDLVIINGLGDYFSNPMNIFNCALLAAVCLLPMISSDTKKIAMFLIILRVAKPVLRIYSRYAKLKEAAGKASEAAEESGEDGDDQQSDCSDVEKIKRPVP